MGRGSPKSPPAVRPPLGRRRAEGCGEEEEEEEEEEEDEAAEERGPRASGRVPPAKALFFLSNSLRHFKMVLSIKSPRLENSSSMLSNFNLLLLSFLVSD